MNTLLKTLVDSLGNQIFPRTRADGVYMEDNVTTLPQALDDKVDKEVGKGLSSNDFTSLDKTKLDGIEAGAEVNNMTAATALDLTDGGNTNLHHHDARYDGRYATNESVDAKDAILDARIDNILTTPAETVSAQEIIDARQGEASLGANLTSIKDDVNYAITPTYTTLETQGGITSFPINSVDGKVKNFKADGLSLINSVVNGDFSNGATGWTSLGGTLSVSGNKLILTGNGSSPTLRVGTVVKNMELDTIHLMYAKVKADGAAAMSIEIKIDEFANGAIDGQYSINSPAGLVDLISKFTRDMNYLDNNPIWVTIRATYADAATANGKVMEVDGNAGVFAINMTALGIASYTATQMLDLLNGGYFDGLKGVENPTFESVGKNLFDVNAFVEGSLERNYYYISNGSLFVKAIDGRAVGNKFKVFSVKPNTSYRFSVSNQTTGFRVFGLNNKNEAELELANGTTSNYGFNTREYTRIGFKFVETTGLPSELQNIQIEEGTVATAYEPYKSSSLSIQETLRSLPNGIKDRVFEQDGQMWLEKNVEEYALKSTDITGLETTNVNNDVVTLPLTPFVGLTTVVHVTNGQIITDKTKGFDTATVSDLTTNVWTHRQTSTYLWLYVPKGTYASLAAAQTALAGTKIFYQLATPQLINLTQLGLAEGELSSFEKGTLYNTSETFNPKLTLQVPTNQASQIESLLESTSKHAKELQLKANILDLEAVGGDVELLEMAHKIENQNLVTNGDFSNGTTGWLIGATPTIVAGKLRATLTGVNVTIQQNSNYLTNNVYYIRLNFQQSAVGTALPRIFIGSNVAKYLDNDTILRTHSLIHTVPTQTPVFAILAYVGIGNYVELGDVLIINLTATFGAGNEPTKEQVDAVFNLFPNGWTDTPLASKYLTSYTLPTASTTTLGAVKVDGSTITITNGVIASTASLSTTSLGSTINGATDKTTPVDADNIMITDSAATHIAKKVTWANMKATLKAYFDTIYTSYVLPVATTSVLGGVKSGTDITIDVSGNVFVNDDSHNHVIANVDGLQTALDGKLTGATYTATIPSASWTGASAPYSKAVTVTGILSTDIPIIDVVMSGTYATDVTRGKNWSKIYRAVTSANTITFYASAVPTADIPIQMEVIR